MSRTASLNKSEFVELERDPAHKLSQDLIKDFHLHHDTAHFQFLGIICCNDVHALFTNLHALFAECSGSGLKRR